MRRVSREDLRIRIAVALAVLKPYQKSAAGLRHGEARDWLTDMLVDRIMGDPESEAVILVPSSIGSPRVTRIGVWGVDEPYPYTDPLPPPPPGD